MKTCLELSRECRSAPAVWLALLSHVDKTWKTDFKITREALATTTGLHDLHTISRALKALENAGWIELQRRKIPSDGGVITVMHLFVVFGPENAFTGYFRPGREAPALVAPPKPARVRRQPRSSSPAGHSAASDWLACPAALEYPSLTAAEREDVKTLLGKYLERATLEGCVQRVAGTLTIWANRLEAIPLRDDLPMVRDPQEEKKT